MANTKQAKKRARQAKEANAHNTTLRSKGRTAVKKVVNAIAAGKKDEAVAAYKEMTSVIDSVSDKGIFHKNKAARHKSRLNAKIKAMA